MANIDKQAGVEQILSIVEAVLSGTHQNEDFLSGITIMYMVCYQDDIYTKRVYDAVIGALTNWVKTFNGSLDGIPANVQLLNNIMRQWTTIHDRVNIIKSLCNPMLSVLVDEQNYGCYMKMPAIRMHYNALLEPLKPKLIQCIVTEYSNIMGDHNAMDVVLKFIEQFDYIHNEVKQRQMFNTSGMRNTLVAAVNHGIDVLINEARAKPDTTSFMKSAYQLIEKHNKYYNHLLHSNDETVTMWAKYKEFAAVYEQKMNDVVSVVRHELQVGVNRVRSIINVIDLFSTDAKRSFGNAYVNIIRSEFIKNGEVRIPHYERIFIDCIKVLSV